MRWNGLEGGGGGGRGGREGGGREREGGSLACHVITHSGLDSILV